MAAIGKAGAAERMVVSAIIMAERGEDPLAIHVVAAAALNVLRDLIDKAGDDYVDQVLKIGAFTVASARVNASREGQCIDLS
jgi:chaperonin GroEL (HSP60 family)